ncbi:MAG: biotin/lipoyl-binding protein [Candidatus Omnitrophica bacterium]|nr:biotin/lipoyl-binding protein [Candidatus Omnitrophota bacterium]
MVNVVLPELGEGIEKATVSYWHISKGQKINKDGDLVEIATDKATFNIPAPCSGLLSEILFEEGQEVKVGDTIAIIDESKGE